MVHSPSKATYTVSLYAEYGLRDDLTLIAYAPFFQRITLNKQVGRESEFVYFGGDDAQGIAEVGVRYACGAAVPASSVPTWLRLTHRRRRVQPASVAALRRSLYPWPGYLGVEIAYNFRHDGYDDDFLLNAEAGMSWRRLALTLRAQMLESIDSGDASVQGGAGGLYRNDRRFLGFGPEVGVQITPDLHLSLSVMTGTRLRNAIAAPSYSVGLSTQR